MPYEEPGVKVIQQLALAAANIADAAQLATLVGELYEVFEDEVHPTFYDPLTGAGSQTFAWPGKKTTSVVDLQGIRQAIAEPDSQLLEFAPFPPIWELRDPATSQIFLVNSLTDVFGVNQDEFQLVEGSSAAAARISGTTGTGAQANRLHIRLGGVTAAGVSVGDRIRVTDGVDFDIRGEVTLFADDDITFVGDGTVMTLDADTNAGAASIVANLPAAETPVTLPSSGTIAVGSGASLEWINYSAVAPVGNQHTFTVVGTTKIDHLADAPVTVLIRDAASVANTDGDLQTTPGQLLSATGGFTGTTGARLAIWPEQLEVDDADITTGGNQIDSVSLALTEADVGKKVTIWTDDGAATAADGDLDAVAGELSSASASFTAADVGKVINIGGVYRRVTAVSSGTVLIYSGSALSGTGVTYIIYEPAVRTILAVDVAGGGTTFWHDSTAVAFSTGTGIPVILHRPVYRDVSVVNSDTDITYSGSAVSGDTGFDLFVPVDLFDEAVTYEVFPQYDLLVTYRAMDLAAVNDTLAVFTASDLVALGNVTPSNPLLWAAQAALVAMGTDDTALLLQSVDLWPNEVAGSKSGFPEDKDEVLAYLLALEILAANESVYYMVPLTQNSTVRDAFVSHVDAMSLPETKKERICFLSYKLPLGDVESTTGEIAPGKDAGNKEISDPGQGFSTIYGIIPGNQVTITSPEVYAGDYIVASGSDDDTLILEGDNWGQDGAGSYLSTTLEFEITDGDTTTSGEVDSATANAFKDVEIGDYVRDDATGLTRRITNITAGTGGVFTLLEYEGTDLPSGAGRTMQIIRSAVAVNFYVNPLDRQEQAETLAAIGQARGNRRVTHMWPDLVEMITGTDAQGNEVREYLPSYYAAAAEAGRLSVIPIARSSTGAALAGFTGLRNSNLVFSTGQLNTIAGGGWAVLEQRVAGAAVTMRHLLTTDLSTVKTQEVSFTKNVDNMAKVKRASVEPLLNDDRGRVNITDDFITSLAFPFQGIFQSFVRNEQLVQTTLDGTTIPPFKILSIRQDPLNPDTILEDVELNVPLPANRVVVTFII